MICVEDIDRNLEMRDCGNQVVKGIYGEGWLFRQSEFKLSVPVKWTSEISKPLNGTKMFNGLKERISGSGAKLAKIIVPSRTAFSGTKTEFSPGTYENTFTKTVSFVLLNQGPVVAQKMIYPLANYNDWVIILQRKDDGDTPGFVAGAFEVYGAEQGLKLTEAASEPWSDDTRGGWQVTMQEDGAKYPGIYFLGDGSGNQGRYQLQQFFNGLSYGSDEQ